MVNKIPVFAQPLDEPIFAQPIDEHIQSLLCICNTGQKFKHLNAYKCFHPAPE